MNDSTDLGGFTINEWTKKRDILKHNLEYSPHWEEAVNWYNERLKRRYFDPMKRMEKYATGEGFSLVTIHCSIIEHFASITQGKIHNHKRNNLSPAYEYSSSSQHFQEFLNNSYLFSEYFTASSGSCSIFDSSDFYSNVRCALLHSACTKNNWRINTLSCGHSNPDQKIMTINGQGIKRLFRDILAKKLSKFLENYKIEIKESTIKRLYFARIIDHLCEIRPDDNYPWWRER
ncbi:MAG: hypothetical protein ABW080_19745 [Candidatus Thiodiazotropha sp.]